MDINFCVSFFLFSSECKLYTNTGEDLEFLKGGFFLLLWLAGHTQSHPLSIVFLAKGGFFRALRTIANPPRFTSETLNMLTADT